MTKCLHISVITINKGLKEINSCVTMDKMSEGHFWKYNIGWTLIFWTWGYN